MRNWLKISIWFRAPMEDLKKNWEKSGLTDLLAPRCKTYVRYKHNFKGSRCKQRLFQPFVIVILSKKQIWHCFCQVDTIWTWGWSIYRATIRNWCQRRKWFVTHIKFMTMEVDVFQLFLGDFPEKKIWHYLSQTDIAKSWGWQIYGATTWNWRQIWIL